MAGGVPSGIGVWWPSSSSVPTGWSHQSSFNSRIPKGTTGNAGGTGGGGNHNHSGGNHSHSVASHTHSMTTGTATNQIRLGNGWSWSTAPGGTHNITSGAASSNTGSASTGHSWGSGANLPSYYNMRYIQSDGTPQKFPSGCVVHWNTASAPSGWGQHSGSTSRFIRGASSGGGTGGGGNHTHSGSGNHSHSSISSHNHAGGTFNDNSSPTHLYYVYNYQNLASDTNHTHVGNATNSGNSSSVASTNTASISSSGGGSAEPSYYVLWALEATGGDAWLENAIVMWQGTVASVPDDWIICDGSNGTPNLTNKMIKNAGSGASVGGTGGSTNQSHNHGGTSHGHNSGGSHTHAGWNVENASQPNNIAQENSAGNPYRAAWNHGHSSGDTSATTANINSASTNLGGGGSVTEYKNVIFLQAPEEPASGNAIMFGVNF